MGKIIGFSGSPIKNSNTDRLVKHTLENSGQEYEFVKLSNLNIRPCMACKACAKDNICVVKDDFLELAKKIKNADAIVIGSYTPYGLMDAFTKSLLERFFSLHHHGGELVGKYLVTIVSSLDKGFSQSTHTSMVLESLMEKMKHVGALDIMGSIPCNTCGHSERCGSDSIERIHGKGAVASVENCVNVESQSVWNEGEKMGVKLGNLIEKTEEYIPSEMAQNIMKMMQNKGR